MSLRLFRCDKCNFFPLEIQKQRYFLNSDTFVCGVCQSSTKFDSKINYLLENEYQLVEVDKQTDQSIQILKDKPNNNDKQDTISIQQPQLHLITIQFDEKLLQSLYMNPLNSQLRNSFNVDKANVLKQQLNPFFCTNDKIIRQFITDQNIDRFQQLNFKYGQRRVSRIQHISYCVDKYVEFVINPQEQKQIQKNLGSTSNVINFQLKLVIQKKHFLESDNYHVDQQLIQNRENINNNFKSFQTLCLINFNSLEYQSFCNKQNIQNDQKAQNKQVQTGKNINQIKFQSKLQSFFNIFYQKCLQKNKQSQKQNKLKLQLNLSLQNQKRITQSMAYFSLKKNKSFQQKIQLFSNAQLNQKSPNQHQYYHFYFENVQRSEQTILNKTRETKPKASSLLKLYERLMYFPYCKNKQNFSKLLKSIKNQSPQQISSAHNKQISKISSLQINQKIWNFCNYGPKPLEKPSVISQQFLKSTKPINQVIIFQIFVFWRYSNIKNSLSTQTQDEDQIINHDINLNKIKSSTLSSIISRSLQYLKSKDINNFNLTLKKQANDQILKVLKKNPLKTANSSNLSGLNIEIDRIFCKLQQNRIFAYIFDIKTLISQNFEQLDCIGQNSLPEQLRCHGHKYEKVQQFQQYKNNNPFKKGQNRVCMIKKEQPQEQVQNIYQSSDSDRQTL